MITSTFTRKEMRMVLVGYVGVDSGQVMVGDPCYLNEFVSNDLALTGDDLCGKPTLSSYPFSYEGACHATLSKGKGGQLGKGMAVASSTTYGDGQYPVYHLLDEDGTIIGLFVDFSDHNDEEDEYEESDDDDN